MAINKNIYYAGLGILGALVLTYIFWGADIIPDSVATIGPGLLAAWVDDAAVIIGGIFVSAKWRQLALGTKKAPGLNWKAIAIFLPIILFGLIYVFWGVDLIPDSIPYVGFADDAATVLAAILFAGKLRRRFKA